jgi:hypothetical protein
MKPYVSGTFVRAVHAAKTERPFPAPVPNPRTEVRPERPIQARRVAITPPLGLATVPAALVAVADPPG